jgi:hypothetical protein
VNGISLQQMTLFTSANIGIHIHVETPPGRREGGLQYPSLPANHKISARQ